MTHSVLNRRQLLALSAAAIGGSLLPCRTLFAQKKDRLVSIGGSITEIVVALGKGKDLAATDTTSLYPASMDHLPKVGYMRTLAAEGILSLGPSQVLASELSGPPATIDQLKAAGVVTIIPDQPTLEGLRDKILKVGMALEDTDGARNLADTISQDLEQAISNVTEAVEKSGKTKPRAVFMHNIGRSTPIAGGTHTPAESMIQFAGGINAFTEFESHKPVSPESMIAAAPDAILMSPGAIERFGGMEDLLAMPHVAGTPAGKNKQVITIDLLSTLGFGPRTAHAIIKLARALHPELEIKGIPERPWSEHV